MRVSAKARLLVRVQARWASALIFPGSQLKAAQEQVQETATAKCNPHNHSRTHPPAPNPASPPAQQAPPRLVQGLILAQGGPIRRAARALVCLMGRLCRVGGGGAVALPGVLPLAEEQGRMRGVV